MIDIRRRMSLERLALCHVAQVGHGPEALAAAAQVTHEERSGILLGQTFADTLALSRPLLDLYEEEAHVRGVWPRPSGSETEELRHFDGIVAGSVL